MYHARFFPIAREFYTGEGSAAGGSAPQVPRADELLFIDSDNALGSRRGDVDDGFALAALLRAGVPIAAIASVFGNTTEADAHENTRALALLAGYTGPLLRGAAAPGAARTEASRFLAAPPSPLRVLALGPLTNLAAALDEDARAASRWSEIVLVGGNLTSRGRWPPIWPHEFNLTQDRRAARAVHACGAPLTVLPLDVARKLRADRGALAALAGPLGARLREHAARWLRRAALVTLRGSFAVYDLAAALYALEPALFDARYVRTRLHARGWLEFGAGDVEVRCLVGFDAARLWERFAALVADECPVSKVL